MAVRRALLAALLVVATTTAGCSLRDWYNQMGTVHVDLLVAGPQESDIEQFRELKVALVSLSLRQGASVDPKEFFFDPPRVVDLVQVSKDGGRLRIAEEKFNLRAITQVTLRLEPLEGRDASGDLVDGCFRGIPHEPPCVRVDRDGVYRLDEQPAFSAKRGGEVTFGFPLAVHWSEQVGEWFIATDVGVVTED